MEGKRDGSKKIKEKIIEQDNTVVDDSSSFASKIILSGQVRSGKFS